MPRERASIGQKGGGPADQRDGGPAPGGARTFRLERFEWSAPDQLEVAGRFSGVPAEALEEPVLVVHRRRGTHRLRALPASTSRAPHAGLRRFGGEWWAAAFAWPGPPRSFEDAELEFGRDLVVKLPPLGRSQTNRRVVLDVDRRQPDVLTATEQLRLRAELAAARAEAEEARARLEEVQQAERRLRQDLEEQRRRRTDQATQFREALDSVRETAEKAVNEARQGVEGLRSELQEAQASAEALRAQIQPLQEEATAAKAELEERQRVDAAARDELRRIMAEREGSLERMNGMHEDVEGLARVQEELGTQIGRLREHLARALEGGNDEQETSPRQAPPGH